MKELVMARRCQLTGKRPLVGNRVSHSHRKTKRRQLPNLQKKRIYIPELDRWVQVKLSTRALRTLNKKGLLRFLRDEGMSLREVIG
jgi:large subunit ribosomal protein L28